MREALEPGRWEVGCQAAHRVNCQTVIRANSVEELVKEAMRHGTSVHSFTPVFYSQERRQQIIQAARRTH